jgi:hypothetical protein
MEKKQKDIIEEIPAPYYFTDNEKLNIGKKMAETYQNLASLEDEKKQVTSQYKAKEEAMRADANLLQIKIIQGYETRQTRCKVSFDPKAGKKFYYHIDTFELLETRVMTKYDYEQSLPGLDEEKQPEEKFPHFEPTTPHIVSADAPADEPETATAPEASDSDKDDIHTLSTAEPKSARFEVCLMNAATASIEAALKDAKGKRKKILEAALKAPEPISAEPSTNDAAAENDATTETKTDEY